MIARSTKNETVMGGASDVWSALAAPLPEGVVRWRQDGKPVQRSGRWYARFVAYIDAHTVLERLDAVVPGEHDFTMDLLPPITGDGGMVEGDERCSFKGRMQILGVIRECVGSGKDYKSASTDTFKRTAVRFGIGRELYAMEPLWVEVDGDGRYAKPVEDPAVAYARKHGPHAVAAREENARTAPAPNAREQREASETAQPAVEPTRAARATDEPECPKCGNAMWNNTLTKRNPKAPDYKCRDRSCDGVIWPDKKPKPDTIAVDGRGEYAAPELDDADLLF